MIDEIKQVNSVFEQPWWLNIVAEKKWREVLIKENGDIIARLPYVIEKNKIVMPPLTQTLGIWIKPELKKPLPGNKQLKLQKEILCDIISQLPKHRYFKMTFDSSNSYILPFRWMGYSFVPTFSYRINSLNNLNNIYGNFSGTVKKNIKYSEKKVEIIDSINPDDLLVVLEKTFTNQNRRYPHSPELIHKIVNTSIQRQSGKLFVSIDSKGNKHAAAFLLFDKNICYYLLGGADPEYRNQGAPSLILWEAIKYASKSSQCFDFEGSMVEGIENFFRQFGGVQVTNYSVRKLPIIYELYEGFKPRIKKIIGYKN